MVKEVRAWADCLGGLHATELLAAESDALIELKKLQIFNQASAMAIVAQAEAIAPILQQVVEARKAAKTPVKLKAS